MSKETDDILEKTQQVAIEIAELRDSFDTNLNALARLRDAVDKNADLYRRDVQHLVDLIEDTKKGRFNVDALLAQANAIYQNGRKELTDSEAAQVEAEGGAE